jgi:hypothetical protein
LPSADFGVYLPVLKSNKDISVSMCRGKMKERKEKSKTERERDVHLFFVIYSGHSNAHWQKYVYLIGNIYQ